ncbi:UDP-N-acetylmuramoyl-tripeptide--D-alanyl-D-alanine ligase [Virgibacillus xinjiangensis]|uniref:UDP-N-acetylmuramoyl-tripeptide--D-alanyl-D-alanine ligase n=1 Tax=Virgibacillus xinjiangensis TaxID=393090 RepID=A0ABV7CV84_9BACI
MTFTIEWISHIFEKFDGEVKNVKINEIMTDSRKVTKDALFVPIKGENFDAHDFLMQAVENGAAATLWNRKKNLPEDLPAGFPVFYVEDTTVALQTLAQTYREEVDPVVIGVTGSNGKTTTKDLIASVMKTSYRTHYTDGNYNNHIGLPLTILSMPSDTEALVLEMGMSAFGEIDLLSRLSKPDYAVITNIGESHIEYLGSRAGIARAKLEITSGLNEEGLLLIDGDEELLNDANRRKGTIACGFGRDNDEVISNVDIGTQYTTFKLGDMEYKVPLLGKHHALNAAFAVILGRELGIPIEKRKKGLSSLNRTGMRFEMLQGKKGAYIINDAYNASPTSMKAAIEVVKQLQGYQERVLVLGDVLELGEDSAEYHRSVAEVIEEPITAVLTFGNEAEYIAEAVKQQHSDIFCQHYSDRKKLSEDLPSYLQKDALLLFKASRGLKFETFIESLIQS